MHLVAVCLVLEEAGKNGGHNESRNHGPEILKNEKNVLWVYCALRQASRKPKTLPQTPISATNGLWLLIIIMRCSSGLLQIEEIKTT